MNIPNIKQEQIDFLRNNNVFSIAQRGVTTTTATGTLSGTATITIALSTVKNIRSITVATVSKYLGEDYTINYKHATGCIITFGSNQTGAYVVTYDYGTDKIFPDFPRNDLTISSYPRIALDVINAPTEAFGIGGTDFISSVAITIVVFDDNSDDLDSYVQAIWDLYKANAKNFYYMSFVKPTMIGPTLNSQDKMDEIMQKNIDILGMFNVN